MNRLHEIFRDNRLSNYEKMYEMGSFLIGANDAQIWVEECVDVFNHPRFSTNCVPFWSECKAFKNTLNELHIDNGVIWAHPHPDIDRKFGYYIVRIGTGDDIIYEGRDINEVRVRLGLRANFK